MKKINFMRKALCLAVVMILTSSFALTAQTYRYIKGWPKEANDRIESFLNSTIPMKERKVAIFDCDGTLFGQVPYYLADEALFGFAQKTYGNRTDKEAKEKMLKAHSVQTELICKEADGEDFKIGLLMIHAQDHLMTSILARELIEEIIYVHSKIGVLKSVK